MNAILLGTAALGALVAMYASPMARQPIENPGFMTHTVNVDPVTGEKTVINVIGFKD